MSTEKLERFCADAVNQGVIITPDQARHLLPLSPDKAGQLGARLLARSKELREETTELLHPLVRALSEFLTPESLSRTCEELFLFARGPVGALRLSDVRTEVLASWLAEIETSDSSSGCADGESTEGQS